MGHIVLRHLRAHVADNRLDNCNGDPGKPGVLTERVAARMQVFHADRPGPAVRDARRPNTQPIQKLFDPVGNPVRVLQVHLSVFREYILGFCSRRSCQQLVELIRYGDLHLGPGFSRFACDQTLGQVNVGPFEGADISFPQVHPHPGAKKTSAV